MTKTFVIHVKRCFYFFPPCADDRFVTIVFVCVRFYAGAMRVTTGVCWTKCRMRDAFHKTRVLVAWSSTRELMNRG